MRKFLGRVGGILLGLMLVVAGFFMTSSTSDVVDCGVVSAQGESIYDMTLDYNTEILEISELVYYIDGIKVSFSLDGFMFDEALYPYKAEFSGESGNLGLMEGDARVEYFETTPFLDELMANGYDVSNILVDHGSDFYCKLKPKNENDEKKYFINTLSYKIGRASSYYRIDNATLKPNGDIEFSGYYNELEGYYSQTLNVNYTFNYNYIGDDFFITAKSVTSDIILNLSSATKMYGVSVSGDGATHVTTNSEEVAYEDVFLLEFTPSDGKILKQLDLYCGDSKIISLFGGMQARSDYFFQGGQTHDKKISYGTFALGYESEFNFKSVTSSGNYATLEVVKPEGEPYADEELFTIKLTSSGVVRVESRFVSGFITANVSAQKYVEIDLINVVDTDKQSSSVPFSLVQVGSGENEKIYDENIPSIIFAFGFEDHIYIKVDLAPNYNFTEDVDGEKVFGSSYIYNEFGGGKLSIYAWADDTVTLDVRLYYNGDYFQNSDTKIYISTRSGVSSIEDFSDVNELSDTSASGYAKKRGLEQGTIVKVYVQISPYYMMRISDTLYSKYFAVFDYEVTQNQSINITVEKFVAQRPVVYNGEQIGEIRISFELLEVYELGDGDSLYSAIYLTTFRAIDEEEFKILTKKNPSLYGYDFLGLTVDGNQILTYFDDNSYGVNPSDIQTHELIADKFFASPQNGLEIVAVFESRMVEFGFLYNHVLYNGKVYFDQSEFYLDTELQVVEPGMYFGGVSYVYDDGEGEFYVPEGFVPVLVSEGEFAGMYKYELTSIWNVDDNSCLYEPLILNKSFNITFVFTTSETTYQNLSGVIKYGDEFTVQELNTESWQDPTIGEGYNLIGWQLELDDEVIFVVKDEAELLYGATITYTWVEDVRLVPVFSQEITSITIYDDNGDYLNSITVKYDQPVSETLNLLLKNEEGDFFACYKFGYDFLGFYDDMEEGSLVIAYDSLLEYVYSCVYETEYFGTNDDGEHVWQLLTNLDLYARLEPISYMLTIKIQNPEFVADEISANTGDLTVLSHDGIRISGFNITDTLVISGLAPKTNAFVKQISIGTSPEFKNDSFVAVCDRAGDVSILTNDEKFDASSKFTLVVSDLIATESDGMHIYMEIAYEPITYVVSFTANIVDFDGNEIYNDKSETYYYKFTAENAFVDRYLMWQHCDENGRVISDTKGWRTLTTPTLNLEFLYNSLLGISGISYTTIGGTVYSFKSWKDFDDDIVIKNNNSLAGAYDFVSAFSDEFDVQVNYYIYNDISKNFTLHYEMGYFWSFDLLDSAFRLDNAITANAYEIYLVNGKLYYISGWVNVKPASFELKANIASSVDLNSAINVSYSAEQIVINYYAVYSEFVYELVVGSNSYTLNVSLPNDPNGNSYSSDDVVWVAVNKAEYNRYNSSGLSTADKLSYIFSFGSGINSAIVKRGNVLENPYPVSDSNYVFACVQRKVDGERQNSLYMAIKIEE